MPKAVLEFSQKERFGSFDCWGCKNEIYRWSDVLKYVEWDFVYSWVSTTCRIIGPISSMRRGIFRTPSIWNAPTTNKQRNAPRNSYLARMPSFGTKIGL
jgi:hypothetical protein